MSDKLTTKQRLFVEAYLANPNATDAARKAGYKGNDNTLAQVGKENLRKPYIAALIGERVEQAAMSADEVLSRLSEHARASLFDVIDADGNFDLEMARQRGKDHLLKKFKVTYTKEGMTREYEIHDPQAALVHLGRYHKLFTDKSEITGKDGGPVETSSTIIIQGVKGTNPPDEV